MLEVVVFVPFGRIEDVEAALACGEVFFVAFRRDAGFKSLRGNDAGLEATVFDDVFDAERETGLSGRELLLFNGDETLLFEAGSVNGGVDGRD
jgi:hypothetical protein